MPRHGIYPRDIIPPVSDYFDSGRFGRMFCKLPAFASDTPRIRKALLEIGAIGGPMDAREALDADPKDLITDLNLSANNTNNPKLSAGMTFLGQFLDHKSSVTATIQADQLSNCRKSLPRKPRASANLARPNQANGFAARHGVGRGDEWASEDGSWARRRE